MLTLNSCLVNVFQTFIVPTFVFAIYKVHKTHFSGVQYKQYSQFILPDIYRMLQMVVIPNHGSFSCIHQSFDEVEFVLKPSFPGLWHLLPFFP